MRLTTILELIFVLVVLAMLVIACGCSTVSICGNRCPEPNHGPCPFCEYESGTDSDH